jgi:hypothetical protein
VTASSRTSPFRGYNGKVSNRRNLAFHQNLNEGWGRCSLRTSIIAACTYPRWSEAESCPGASRARGSRWHQEANSGAHTRTQVGLARSTAWRCLGDQRPAAAPTPQPSDLSDKRRRPADEIGRRSSGGQCSFPAFVRAAKIVAASGVASGPRDKFSRGSAASRCLVPASAAPAGR